MDQNMIRDKRTKEKEDRRETVHPDLYKWRQPRLDFCPKCDHLLRARENKSKGQLVHTCRMCGYTRKTDSNDKCVFKNIFTYEADELKRIPVDIIQDPTLARTSNNPCPVCGHRDVVFMQAHLQKSQHEMKLFYVCTDPDCAFKWTM